MIQMQTSLTVADNSGAKKSSNDYADWRFDGKKSPVSVTKLKLP